MANKHLKRCCGEGRESNGGDKLKQDLLEIYRFDLRILLYNYKMKLHLKKSIPNNK